MPTRKIEYSLRLRHDTAELSAIASKFDLGPSVLWRDGELRSNIPLGPKDQERRVGSYCSVELGVAASVSLEDGLAECIAKLQPNAAELEALVRSGGMASLAIAWFSDAVGGDRVPPNVLAELARLHLTLDIYLYQSPG